MNIYLAYVINNARKSQRSLIVTLLELRNAFGEVHHNLINCVLEHHHVPEDVREIVKNLYCCFKTSMLTDGCVTDFAHMEKRGFFQPINVYFDHQYIYLVC